MALFMYGKKTDELLPIIVGMVLMVLPYFLSVWPLSIVSFILILIVYKFGTQT